MTLTLFVVVLLAVALLPSALNIPQSNPNTVPEYAPVPPDEESRTSEQGNLAALGQASGSRLSGTGGIQSQPPPPSGSGQRRAGKKCVGNPPRQTEDLMSPPCVAFFEGDNGGATYQGVTRDEIRVVVHYDGCNGCYYDVGQSETENTPDEKTYCDVDLPPNTGGEGCYVAGTNRDHTYVKFVRAFSNFFNDRYQTYNRRVHFWVYWSLDYNAEGKRASAADNYNRLKPFAALNQIIFSGFVNDYLDALARRNVMLFEGYTGIARGWEPNPAAFFQRYSPQVWSFTPDVEHWAENYSSYVCTKMPPGSVVKHATGGVGTDGRLFNESPRRFGFISTTDPRYPGVQLFAKKAMEAMKSKCGIDPPPEARATYPGHGMECCRLDASQAAAQNAAKLKQANVTTLLWLGGGDIPFTGQAADEIKWYPEVVYAGDGVLERNQWGRLQNQNFFRNAWVVSHQRRQLTLESSPSIQACMSGGHGLKITNCELGETFYPSYFALFQAIQAAGPRLTPRSVDRGMRAIPRFSSTHPDIASCFYEPGDNTCTKDSMEMWWDPNTPAPGRNQPGCFRLVQGGRRYLPSDWTSTDEVFTNPQTAPCSSLSGGGQFEGV